MLLNLTEFFLVALLGFMPLIIIHWADRRPKVRLPRTAWRSVVTAKAAMLVGMSNWFMTVVF